MHKVILYQLMVPASHSGGQREGRDHRDKTPFV